MKYLIAILFLVINYAAAQENFSVFFDRNESRLTMKEEFRLKEWIRRNKKSKVVAINGYTDEVGTTHYNDSLAQKRVDFVFSYIKGKVTIRDDFKSRSFGEKFAKKGKDSENRRATIYFILEKDLEKENEILGIKEEKKVEAIKIALPKDTTSLDFKIIKANVGDKIILKNINFYQNTFAITPESDGALKELLGVMVKHSEMRIQIQGHICCVDKDRRNLSLERAKQVRRFLVAHGIKQERVFVTGFGVNKPLYPIPEENEEQAAANRRVEIEILNK